MGQVIEFAPHKERRDQTNSLLGVWFSLWVRAVFWWLPNR
jgi:hypothetical protein